MKTRMRQQQAFAVIEYVVLIIVVIAALVGFRSYLQRGLQGQYRKAGETFGFGRQYSPTASIECAYDDEALVWYSTACFNNKVLQDGCKNRADYFVCAHTSMQACTAGCAP
ncbi:MAG: hypothetical protein HQL17_08615 [Candidatus Omnitrophica bacterium]|nr:hypothetical protein [Candidatus Omnitrophota bacterium]